MKDYCYILLLIANLTICTQPSAQQVDVVSFANKSYFHDLQQEKFFLHTNKTMYFAGETIWWKAYVVSDFNNKVINNTTNLHVNLYDSYKVLISHQLFYCNDGKAFGEISLPENLKTGRYYINVETQWNKNFEAKYIVPINIVNTNTGKQGDSQDGNSITQLNEEELELEFFPESGNLLDGIVNTVFFTTKNGEGFIANIKGYIIKNSTGDSISKFQSNSYGSGMFKLPYKVNESYTAKLKYNDKTYLFQLKPKLDLGIVIQKKASPKNNTQNFSIKISDAIAKLYHKRELFATIHRNRKLLYVVPIQINKAHHSYLLNISEENMFNGINTISLFNDDNKLIIERPFFNSKKSEINFEVVKKIETKDSITLDFICKNSVASNLSVSILPYKSKLNNNSTSILSAFLVAPYVSSEVDVNLFFNSNVSVLEKDIILQTQILKRVKNKSLKFNIKPVYANENGLVIKGRVNTSLRSLKGFKVLLSSQENGILLTTHIKEGKSFEFNKLKLKKKSNYKLALLNAKGKLVKAGFYIYGDDVYKVDSLLVHSSQKNKIIDKKIIANLNINAYLIIDKTAEVLDEVIIKGKRTKGKVGNEVHPNNPKELGNGFAKNIEIRERDRMNNTVIEFLNNQLGVSASESTLGASVVIQRAAFNSITGDNQALIIFNGVQTNADILSGMRLHDVKNIKINALGAGYGVHGGSGVVVIDLKEGIEDRVTIPSNKYFLSSTDFGFSSSKPVYEAFNSVFSSKLSRSYFETLDWIPNVNLHPNSTQLLQVYKGTHQKIKLFINGMSDHGQLVYKVVEIPLK